MAIRIVRQEGDPILRKISKPIKEITPRIQELATDLIDTMIDEEGAGLAAPQVGVLRRIVAVHFEEGPEVLINPEIISQEGAYVDVEGCLSIQGYCATVERPEKLTVRYQDVEGNTKEKDVEMFFAKAVCHEVDHLDGILFRDRAIEEVDPETIRQQQEAEQDDEN